MRPRFQLKDRTRRQSHDMIQMMAKYGDNPWRFASDADVKRFFASAGYDYADVVQRCRKADHTVPLVENALGSTWMATDGVTVATVDRRTGEEIAKIKGPGALAISTYWQLFESAVDHLGKCFETVSLGSFQSCLSSGVASIEAYIAHRASLYNSRHPSEQLVDSREHKVSFDIKIDEWIPKMSGGKKLNKGRQNWEHFKRLRSVRDRLAIHPKEPSLGIDYEHLCELLNLFRSGIGGLLVDLHLLFGERIPSIIVKYAYLGDIQLIKRGGGVEEKP